jgi:hypothetical protein
LFIIRVFIFNVRFAVTFISIYVYDLPCFLLSWFSSSSGKVLVLYSTQRDSAVLYSLG